METKKPQQSQVSSLEASMSGKRIWNFIGDVKTEFKKITWTNREELQVYTKIVVGTTFAMGLGIYFVDLLIQGVLGGIATFTHLIFG